MVNKSCFSLSPCLGHDPFEGVVVDDVYLCIKHLVTSDCVTYESINKRIGTFKFLGRDSTNRPAGRFPFGREAPVYLPTGRRPVSFRARSARVPAHRPQAGFL